MKALAMEGSSHPNNSVLGLVTLEEIRILYHSSRLVVTGDVYSHPFSHFSFILLFLAIDTSTFSNVLSSFVNVVKREDIVSLCILANLFN